MPLSDTIFDFVSHCREPKDSFSKERADLYGNFLRKRVDKVLKRAYPITNRILQKEVWDALILEFIAKQDFYSPFLWRMPEIFFQFICKNNWKEKLNIPFLDELLHFEWIEIDIFMMPDQEIKKISKRGDVLEDLLFLNPDSRIANYTYPVFEKKKFPRPMQKGSYSVFIFRHLETGNVHFISISPLFQYILEFLQEKPYTGKELLYKVVKELSLEKELIFEKGKQFFKDLYKLGALYGFEKIR